MTTTPLKLRHRIFYFVGIGIFAAVVQITTVFVLVTYLQFHALVANLVGFLLAFNVSFFGHKHLTYSKRADEKILSFPHFFVVAVSSGIINETLYFLLLHYTSLHYLVALFLVLSFVSIYSFTLSRLWACR